MHKLTIKLETQNTPALAESLLLDDLLAAAKTMIALDIEKDAELYIPSDSTKLFQVSIDTAQLVQDIS